MAKDSIQINSTKSSYLSSKYNPKYDKVHPFSLLSTFRAIEIKKLDFVDSDKIHMRKAPLSRLI